MNTPSNRPESRIDVPLTVWPGPGTTGQIAAALCERLAGPGESVTIVDTDIDTAELVATGRRVTWIATSRRAADAVLAHLKHISVAERSRLTVLHSPRGALADALGRYRGRSRLVIAPAHLATDADAWTATVDAIQPAGRLALIDATGPATLPPDAARRLAFHAHIVCAATEVYEHAADHAGALADEIALPVALTRLHRDVAVFCRAEGDGGAQ